MVTRRRSVRLQGYNYTDAGAYFTTLCAHERRCVFGEVVEDAVVLSAWGTIVEACWLEIPTHFPTIELDAYVIMPNHMHGIMVIARDVRTAGEPYNQEMTSVLAVGATHGSPLQPDRPRGPQSGSLGAVLGQFKSSVTRYIRQKLDSNAVVWQRNYYEHIIRDEASLNALREYITHNPARWACDELFS